MFFQRRHLSFSLPLIWIFWKSKLFCQTFWKSYWSLQTPLGTLVCLSSILTTDQWVTQRFSLFFCFTSVCHKGTQGIVEICPVGILGGEEVCWKYCLNHRRILLFNLAPYVLSWWPFDEFLSALISRASTFVFYSWLQERFNTVIKHNLKTDRFLVKKHF